jgi:hypothetical protein
VNTFKSIAVPVTRRLGAGKAKPRAGASGVDRHSDRPAAEFHRQPAQPITPNAVHRFHVGQRLTMARGSRDIARSAAVCQVVALLPHESGPLLYRVRSELESFERVVDEVDLAPYR